jgi:serine/threonine protein kinase
VLVDDSLNAKLTDFGMSRSIKQKSDEAHLMTAVGTPAWTAPEVVTGEGDYNEKVDVVSVCVMCVGLCVCMCACVYVCVR